MLINLTKTSTGLVPKNQQAFEALEKYENGADVDVQIKPESTGTVPMLKTWRGWMNETALAMRHYGCTMPLYVDKDGNPKGSRPYSSQDAHEHFTSVYLGVDELGRRKSWSMSKDPDFIQASMADRLWAMNTHLDWCSEKGIKLTIPENSEFRKENQKVKESEV